MALETLNISGYTVIEQIYRGDKSVIYKAKRNLDGFPVILKTLKENKFSYKDVDRLKHEYDVYKKLNDASISSVVQAFGLENLEGRPVLILEDFQGQTLSSYFNARHIDLKLFLAIAIDIAKGLGDIHHQQIIHKDINPSNILVNPITKKIKIIDFGISTFLPREIQHIVTPTLLEGTAAYISPEQTGRMNRPIDYRTDIYSLGISFYEILTKQLPFQAKELIDLIHLHIAKLPTPLNEIDPRIPKVLSEIVLKCLSKDAEDRYKSAYGLQNDLKEHLVRLSISEDEYFEPGQRDIFDYFHIPEKIYGRKTEIKHLFSAFERTNQGDSELLLVAGYSGIGKSSLVREVQRPIEEHKGHFISGKFDQFQQNIPYHAFIQAFQQLIQLLLTESESKLAAWQSNLLKALGSNGQVICDVIPELKLIIGDQPLPLKLSPQEEEIRFQQVFSDFIQVFLQPEHPLVIFLDDLQWADFSSLKLIEFLLIHVHPRYLLMIGAYRDNEVFEAHPLLKTLANIQQGGKLAEILNLLPLKIENTIDLIKDTFHTSAEQIEPLAYVIQRKTQGNPFFIIQFLKILYQDGLLDFNAEQQSWTADLSKIERLSVTENVADLLSEKIRKLPEKTLDLLKIGSAIGKKFELNLIALISGLSPSQARYHIWPACQQEFVLQEEFIQYSGHARTGSEINIRYTFQHDRIQQAAYHLIPEKEVNFLHYQIGKVLLETIPKEKRNENAISIVNQLNQGIQFIDQTQNKLQLAHLNSLAGEKALSSIAYSSACQYFIQALELIDDKEKEHDFVLSLYKNLAISSYMGKQFEEAEKAFESAIRLTKDPLEKGRLYVLKVNLYTHLGRNKEAIEAGLKCLQVLAFDPYRYPIKLQLIKEFLTLQKNLYKHPLEDIHKLPHNKDQRAAILQQLFFSITFPLHTEGRQELLELFSLLAINLNFKYGLSEYSVYAFNSLALFYTTSGQRQYKRAYECGLKSIEIANQFNSKIHVISAQAFFYCYLNHLRNHLKTSIEPLKDLFYESLKVGNAHLAAMCLTETNAHMMIAGRHLDFNEQEIEKNLELLTKYQSELGMFLLIILRDFIRALKGSAHHPLDHFPTKDSEIAIVKKYREGKPPISLIYDCFEAHLLYLYGHYEEAYRILTGMDKTSPEFPGAVFSIMYAFLQCLVRLAYAKQQKHTMKQTWPSIKKFYRVIEKLSQICPENQLHRYYLMTAELNSLRGGNSIKAADLYEKAISQAKKNEFIQDEALACDLAARFHLNLDHSKLAAFYMQESYRLYLKWGAIPIATFLAKSYPNLLAPLLKQEPLSITDSNSLHTSSISPTTTRTSTESTMTEFELNAVMQAAQLISEEIILGKLISKMMHITIAHAGADKSLLILKNNNQLTVVAEMAIGQENATLFDYIPIEQKQEEMCLAVINYVARSFKSLLLDDATHKGNFTHDPYIMQAKPQSILCIPLVNQGKLTGILYLENKLSKGAFTSHHLHLLSLISSQMAISIENAFLYANLETKVEERATKIKEMQTQLMQQEKLASLGFLTAGIAHEIKNPLNFVINFSSLSLDLLSSLEEDLDKISAQLSTDGQEEIKGTFDTLKENITTIYQQGKRADSIIQRMLAHSRVKTTQTTTAIDIHKLLEEYIALSYHGARVQYPNFKVKIETEFDPTPQTAEIVAEDMGRVFLNLLNNAYYTLLKKKSEKGEGFTPTIWIKTKKIGQQLEISIRDNGQGIPSHLVDKIFTPFFTTKPPNEGTGLGLSLSHNIVVQENGGSLSFETEEGEFTEFKIVLPLRGDSQIS